MQSTISQEKKSSQENTNDQYAEQWIAFLRKRNMVLNIVWPILLVLVAITSLSAIYYYQLHLVSQQEMKNVETELAYTKSEYTYLQADFDAMRDSNDELSAELERLKNDKSSLSEKQYESVTQLDLSNKLVTALKQKVDVIQSEKSVMREAIDEAKALLIQQKRVSAAEIKDKENAINELTSNLDKQISTRKVAYQALVKRQHEMQGEIDRLANVETKNDAEIKLVTASKKSVQKNLLSTKQRYNALTVKYSALEQKMQGVQSSIATSSEGVNPQDKVKLQSNDMKGLEEIKRPVKLRTSPLLIKKYNNVDAVKNNNASAFDYDKITID